jgi:regulatory protein
VRVTAIEKQRRGKRVSLFLDGRFAFGLSLDVVTRAGLRAGDEVDDAWLRELRYAEARAGATAAALRLLSYRQRSEAELRQRLTRRGTPPTVVDETLARLRKMGLVDDSAFAQAWVERRESASPRSRRLLRQELLAMGVGGDISCDLLDGVDDADAALRAAARRTASLRGLPCSEFRRRLGNFLRRRGFGHALVRRTVDRRWREITEQRDSTAAG